MGQIVFSPLTEGWDERELEKIAYPNFIGHKWAPACQIKTWFAPPGRECVVDEQQWRGARRHAADEQKRLEREVPLLGRGAGATATEPGEDTHAVAEPV